jgi:hypothetical protein
MKLIGTLHLYIRPPYIVSTPRQSTQFTFSPKHFNPHLRHQIPDDNLDPSTLFDHSLRFDALDHLQPSSVDQSAVFVALFNSLERFRAPRSHRDIFKNSSLVSLLIASRSPIHLSPIHAHAHTYYMLLSPDRRVSAQPSDNLGSLQYAFFGQ